jgi:hypothetical protein
MKPATRRIDLLPVLRRRLAVLLWLSLLIPSAQSLLGWHVASHQSTRAAAPDHHKRVAHPAHCDVCLVAAAVSIGGATARSPIPVPLQLQVDEPARLVESANESGHRFVYHTRAPPLTRC